MSSNAISMITEKINNATTGLVNTSGAVIDDAMELNVVYTVFEILVAASAVVGNALVILVFHRERRLRRRTNYYIVSLAAADFLVGLLGIPFAILASVGLPRNLNACLFTVSLLVVLCTISIFCLVAVSIDRYWAILHPMGYSRNVRTKTAIGIIVVCWLAGCLIGFLPLLGWHSETSDPATCLFTKVMDYNYLVFLYFATIIFPALVLAGFYAHIYQVVLKQLRQMTTMNPIPSGATSVRSVGGTGTMLRMLGAAQKREVKAMKNLSIIVLFFIICWFPLYTINCVQAFCPSCVVPSTATHFCIILSHLNSAGNPLLYAYHLRDFRAALKNFLCGIINKGDGGITDGPGLRPSMGSHNALHHYGITANSRNNSMQSIQNVGRLGVIHQQTFMDSPTLRSSRMLVPSAMMTTNNSSTSSIISSMTSIHQTTQTTQTTAVVPLGVEKVKNDTTEPSKRMWTLKEVSSVSEDDPMPTAKSLNTDNMKFVTDIESLKVANGGQINSGYTYDIDITTGNDDDVFIPLPENNWSIISALKELPFSHCSSGSMEDDGTNCFTLTPPLSRKMSEVKNQRPSVANGDGFTYDERESLSNSTKSHVVQEEAHVNDDGCTQISPKCVKDAIVRNGNNELKRTNSNEDLKLSSLGSHCLSPLKAVSEMLIAAGNNKSHQLKEEKDAIENDETNVASGSSHHHNGSVIQREKALIHS